MAFAMAGVPRYPKISVEIQSDNPLALVAAVREALRLAHVQRAEISRFSDQAFACRSSREMRRICEEWVRLEARPRN